MVAQVHVAVIGAGVIGLSTALNIQAKLPRSKIKVIAEKFDADTTSYGSGGLFFATLNSTDEEVERRMRNWCRDSWNYYRHLATGSEAGNCGACISNGYILTRKEYQPFFKDYVFSYRKMDEAEKEQFNFPSEYKHAYSATTIVLDQRKYLKWLMNRFLQKGGELEQKKVSSLKEFVGNYDVVVNCTGLGSRDLAEDREVFAVRGQLLKVKAPWIKNFLCNPESDKGFPTFIIPGDNFVTLGGTNQVGDENVHTDAKDSTSVLQRCTQLCPSLKSAEVNHVFVGLRPGRSKVRLEAEQLDFHGQKMTVVHNYGHASDGVALAWGTSVEAAGLVKDALDVQQARL